MASYTYEEKGLLLSTPIEAVLSFYGKDTSHDYWRIMMSFKMLKKEDVDSQIILPQ